MRGEIFAPAYHKVSPNSLSSKDGVDLDLPASQSGDSVRVYAPRVSAAQQSFASVSFQNGKEKETVVRRILIVP